MTSNKKKKANRMNTLLPPLSAYENTGHQVIEGDHPAMLDEEALLKQVILDFGRSSGPGGQHRNRKATACTATYLPFDISGEATERRRQSENRKLAIGRLRRTLAIQLRRAIDIDSYSCSDLWESRRQGDQFAINPKHQDYPNILAEALDVIFACEFDMPSSAQVLHISATQLLKVVSHDKAAITWLNTERKDRALPALKT